MFLIFDCYKNCAILQRFFAFLQSAFASLELSKRGDIFNISKFHISSFINHHHYHYNHHHHFRFTSASLLSWVGWGFSYGFPQSKACSYFIYLFNYLFIYLLNVDVLLFYNSIAMLYTNMLI